jgi:phosphatidylglycerol lysyltransferase
MASALDPESSVWSGQFGKKLLVQLGALISLAIVCLALWVLYQTLHEIRLADVLQHFKELPAFSIILGFVVTAISYFVVTGYEVLVLHYLNRPIPYPRAALASFLASAFGNNIGFALFTGASVRYRIYTPIGLSTLEIAGITAMCSLTTLLGISFIFALSMLLSTGTVAESAISLPLPLRRGIGIMILGAMAGYVIFTSIRPITLRSHDWALQLPSAKMASAQIALASFDLMLVGTLIYVLLPTHTGTNFFEFLGIFALALFAGSMSNVPGGIGVFETVLIVGLPDTPTAALLGSILLFRCIYYLTPLGLAAVLLVAHEATQQQERFAWIGNIAADWLAEFTPQVLGVLIIVGGIVLLFSGAVPPRVDRLELLRDTVPLPVLELSHMLGSAAGLGLIILARGLSRRLYRAYYLSLALLAIGIVASLLKGLDYVEAITLSIILVVVASSRTEFQRQASLFRQGFTLEWISTLTIILAVTVWLGLFSYKHIEYTHELWWHFAYEADLSRFLRSTVVIFVLIGGATLVNLLRSVPKPDRPEATELDHVRRIIEHESITRANLALLGDKRLLFSDSGSAFIMYQVQGKSWIALGDPIGPGDEHQKLLRAFRELCDRRGGWPVFYLIDAEGLSRYVDLGLSLLKLGDEARVPLDRFSVEYGGTAVELRHLHDSIAARGFCFEMVNSIKVPSLIPELKRVSDDWLATTHTQERGFSMGFFDPDYIANFPCALVRSNDHRLVAFAILWASPNKEELALDLMRYHHDAPKGVMDYLLIELMRGGRARGYRWFNLGVAPLSDLEAHPLAPLWHRIGRLMYRQSEHFRDLENLRRYEERLNPVWRPKYLASPGGLNTLRILRNITKLIARGRK